MFHVFGSPKIQITGQRESWVGLEAENLEKALPVPAAGSGDASTDFRYVATSIRQQRMHARAVELRMGEYLARYDDDRALAVDEAFRAGRLEEVKDGGKGGEGMA